MKHPYADLIGFTVTSDVPGESRGEIHVRDALMNPHNVVHGGVLYSLADTCMGGALYPLLDKGQTCATIDCSITYFRSISAGAVVCESKVVNKGRSIAALEAEITNDGRIVAKAYGNFSIMPRRAGDQASQTGGAEA